MAVRIPPADRDRLKALARENDRTPSGEIRRAIRFYLSNYERLAADALDGLRERVAS